MLYKEILRLVGRYLIAFSFFLLIPLAVAGYYQFWDTLQHHPQPHSTLYFFYTLLLTWCLGGLCLYGGRNSSKNFYRREGIAAVVLIWLITPAISALPFVLSGTISNPYQAYFEAASGYTTTGASIIQAKSFDRVTNQEIPIVKVVRGIHDTKYVYYGNIDPVINPVTGEVMATGVEAVSKALLFWRSFTQWLGGVGVVVLFVAILPALGVGGKVLFRSEVSSTVSEGATPRIKETAMQLWKIYIFLTVLQIGVLYFVNRNLEWLDIFTLTFSTLSTGGFSIKNTNIAAYNDLNTEIAIMAFMVAGAVNFSLYYYIFKGKFYKLYDSELIVFLLLILAGGLYTTCLLLGKERMGLSGEWLSFYSWGESFRDGYFQIISSITSSGFANTNYDVWPYLPQLFMILAAYIGGMSGSTSGGTKTVRLFILFKVAQNRVESLFRPETVRSLKIGGKDIDYPTSLMVFIYILMTIFLSILALILFMMEGYDPETSLGMVASFINNVGFGFRAASPVDSFAFLSDRSLIVASLLMIMGRLEFFAFFAVLIPSFWTQDS